MNTKTLFITIMLVFSFLSISTAQILGFYGPDTSQYRRLFIDTDPPTGSMRPINSSSPLGWGGEGQYRFRDVYQWSLPDSVFPVNSIIDTVEIIGAVTTVLGDSVGFYDIGVDLINPDGNTVWNNFNSTRYLSTQAIINSAFDAVFTAGSSFCAAVQNALSQQKFIMGVKGCEWCSPSRTIYHGSVKIRIVFTRPSVSTIVNQLSSTSQNVDSIGHWENGSFHRYPVPQPFTFGVGTNEVLQSAQKLINGEKYNNWNGIADVTNHHVFLINSSTTTLNAYLQPATSGIVIKNDLLEMPGTGGGTVNFQDPWLVDQTDSAFYQAPYGFRNLGMNAPFKSETSPFTITTGSKYKGVFLNQSYYSNQQHPYYSLQASLNQTVGGYPAAFIGWISSGANITNPYNTTTPVVFNNASDVVTALYKMSLKSMTAYAFGSNSQSSNSQQKFVDDGNGSLTLAYESAGTPYYTYSQNSGSTWNNEQLFEPGVISNFNTIIRSPSLFIEPYSGYAAAVWERVDQSGSTWTHSLKYNRLNVPLNPLVISGFNTSADQPATPAAVSNTPDNFIFTAWRDAASINYALGRSRYGDWDYLSVGNVASSSTAVNPAVACNTASQTVDTVCAAWEEPGSGGGILWKRGTFNQGTTTISWSGPYSVFTNSGSAVYSKPAILYAPGTSSYAALYVACEYTNGTQSGVKIYSLTPRSFSYNWTQQFLVSCPGGTASGISLRADGADLTLTWYVSGVGLVGARYINGSWSDQYVINSYAVGRGVLLNSPNPGSSNRKYMSISGPAAPYTISPNPIAMPDPSAPAAPALSSPANNATLTTNGVTVSWVCSYPATGYKLQYATNSSFTDSTNVNTASNSSNLSLLDGTYYWRVQPSGGNGIGSWSAAWQFTVSLSQNVGLSVFRSKNPDLGGVYHPTLQWSGGTSPFTIWKSDDTPDALHAIVGNWSSNTFTDNTVPMSNYDNTGIMEYYKVTWNGGKSNVGGIQSGVVGMDKAVIAKPKYTSVATNYPNPFNPSTTFEYQLSTPGYVNMTLFNSLGQEVKKLVDEQKNEGYYNVRWDASSQSSGIYFVRVRITDNSGKAIYQDLKKVLLVK
ncbi:MAG: T9SS type A sorting domain-containing protein [Bacteroidota bacterium]